MLVASFLQRESEGNLCATLVQLVRTQIRTVVLHHHLRAKSAQLDSSTATQELVALQHVKNAHRVSRRCPAPSTNRTGASSLAYDTAQ